MVGVGKKGKQLTPSEKQNFLLMKPIKLVCESCMEPFM